MEMYAQVEHGALVRFFAALPPTFKGSRHVLGVSDSALKALGLFPVVDLTVVFDPLTHRLSNAAPSTIVWPDRVELTRQIEAIPAAEVTARIERDALQNDARAVDLRDRLRTATVAQIDSYVDAQVTDLASARTMFKRILLVMALLCR